MLLNREKVGYYKLWSLLLVISALHDGVTSHQLFDVGKEYKYSYFGLFTTGTEEPVAHASSYMLIGQLRVQGNAGNSMTAKLEGMKMAVYNGKWSYFPIPQFGFFDDEKLSTLEEPFQIELTEDGKFKSITMNDQEPEYASNMKRGLATYLQMNLTGGFNSIQIFKEPEMTTMGECPTSYEVTPVSPSTKLVRLGKFRNHADCPDIPKRTRLGTRSFYQCATENTRDLLNSTSYSNYEISLDEPSKNPTINKITIFSSILYWPFTSGKQFLYTWFNVTLSLTEVGPIQTPIIGPENAEVHEDLSFVFEQSDYQDPEEEMPDLKTIEPFYFHQTSTDMDTQGMGALVAKAKEAVEKVAESFNTTMDDFNKSNFHSNSPLVISKMLSYLDHDSLKLLYRYYSAQSKENPDKETQLQLFIDGLVLAGTSATTMALRDIIVEDFEDEKILGRILPLFPNYIRTPSEILVKEFDIAFDLLKNPKISPNSKQMLEFSLASLISRGCERNLCSTTGILDKYINYFETKLENATHFGDKTTAVLGLRNLQIGKSLNKLVDIAVGDYVVNSNIVRVQAIWSLRPLFSRDAEMATQTLLRVFYNRTESCEIRTSIFGLIMSANPKEKMLHQIAYFMWSETCPQTLNIVRSTLTHMSKSVDPCSSKISTFARTILKYLPPGSIHTTRTTSYAIEYFDQSTGIGRSFYSTIQKSGSTALPVSIYFGASHTIGGYTASPMGIFIRMEGLGKFIPKNIIQGKDFETAEKILRVLSDLKVKTKVAQPLRLELTIVYMNSVIYHYAADEESLRLSMGKGAKQAEAFLKTLSSTSFNNTSTKAFLVGEALYEIPLEVGLPISLYTSAVALSQTKSNIKIEPQGKTIVETDIGLNFNWNLFATTKISNHVPVFGTVHTAGLLRTLRVQEPIHSKYSWNMQLMKLEKSTYYPASAENPIAFQTHATSFTSMSSELPTANDAATTLLAKSCPNCQPYTLVSSGPGAAKTEEIFSTQSWTKGTRLGLKKVMCEKHISKTPRLFQKLQNFVTSTNGKNTGFFDTTYSKFILGYYQGLDYIFLWPNSEPMCGFQLFEGKNPRNSSHILEKIETLLSFGMGVENDPKRGQIQQLKIDENITIFFEGGTLAPDPQRFTVHLEINPEVEGGQELRGRYTIDGQKDGRTLVACYAIENYASIPRSDPLGFSGDNEPKVNQSIVVTVGKASAASSGGECPSDLLDVRIFGEAQRSMEQIAEAATTIIGSNQDSSYSLCHMEQQSGNWPNNVIPPTRECFKVALDQTSLRSINMSIKYKVAENIRPSFRPFYFIGNLLSPFLVDDQDDDDDKVHNHSAQNHGYDGQLEIDMNLKKQDPTMNIHFIGAKVDEEQYYQDIDLDLLPSLVQFQPTPARFAPTTQYLYRAGFLGSCALSPSTIVTFDNQKYAVKVPECETLVVADCSERPDFAVFAKTSANKKLSVRIMVRGAEFEITNDQVIMINDASSGTEVVAFDEAGNFVRNLLRIKKDGKEISVKWRVVFGIEVRYSGGGDFIQVILGSRYRALTCGLCGNFDTSPQNDMHGPTTPNCPLSSIPQAWMIKSETCEQLANVTSDVC